jgi:tetratricopeptide (TPR) repeat protein
MYEEAIVVYTRALGVDNKDNAVAHWSIALAKCESGDLAGALESARECVRIYDKHGITDEYSRYAGDMVMKLEGIE